MCVTGLKPEHATHLACGRAHTLISTGIYIESFDWLKSTPE